MNSTELAELVQRGLEFHRAGDLVKAGEIYGDVLTHDPLRADALHLFGLVLYQLGEPVSAADAIARAIALSPNQAHFHANLAEVDRSLGRFDRAAGSLILALRLRPDRFTTPEDFDILFLRKGELDEVRVPPRRRADPLPPSALVATNLAMGLQSSGDLKGALDPFLEAVRLAPDFPETWNQLGNVYHALGRSLEARSSYLEALRLAPEMTVVLNSLGLVLVDAHRPKEALDWFRLALASEPVSVSIRANLAWVLREIGQLDEALSVCQEALELAPDSFEAHICLGSIVHELKRFEEAKRAFSRAIELNPDSLLAHQSQGILLTEMGDLEGADRAFREVLRLPGEHARALSGLANIHRGRLAEADLEAFHKALRDPNLPDISRAEIHYAASVVYDARRQFDRACDHLHLANSIRLAANRQAGRGSPV